MFNFNDDLFIDRTPNGIKLVTTPVKRPLAKIADLMRVPLNFYFTDHNSMMLRANELTAQTCGYSSERDAVGRSIRDVAKGETARQILNNDRSVVLSGKKRVTDEHFTRLDDVDLLAISFKFPIYQDDQIAGVFGCSILQGQPGTLAQSLTVLIQTGLLNAPICPGVEIDQIYYSKREKEIIRLTVRGKTAKEIAKILGYSHRTIEHSLEKIKAKADVNSKSALIVKMFDYFSGEGN